MDRVYNFSAGPSVLPLEVLEKVQKELLAYENSGMSVMEMSHRSKEFLNIIQSAESLLREIMNIPNNYKVLFLQGGATLQFSMLPINLFRNKAADYVNTGQWSTKAIQEAKLYGDVNVVASSKESIFNHIPTLDKSKFNPNADYFHITMNNTIFGTRFTELPDTGNVPIATDMSSCILSEVYDVSKFGVIYAGAQKNIAPSGMAIVIIRDDLIGHAPEDTPTYLNYKVHAENDSLYNTPPTFTIYFAKLVFEWIKAMGGVAAMQKVNEEKAGMFYDYLDNSKMFNSTVAGKDRSLMNIPFVTGNEELDAKFIKEAKFSGFVNLAGHRSVGGMRASIYNAMPVEGVKALIDFMKKFETQN